MEGNSCAELAGVSQNTSSVRHDTAPTKEERERLAPVAKDL